MNFSDLLDNYKQKRMTWCILEIEAIKQSILNKACLLEKVTLDKI
jgi:hypothetical protein